MKILLDSPNSVQTSRARTLPPLRFMPARAGFELAARVCSAQELQGLALLSLNALWHISSHIYPTAIHCVQSRAMGAYAGNRRCLEANNYVYFTPLRCGKFSVALSVIHNDHCLWHTYIHHFHDDSSSRRVLLQDDINFNPPSNYGRSGPC